MAVLIKHSLVDQIYEELRNEIISQNFSLGEKINVNELQSRFGISSTPIREALNRLQKEGLVEYKNNFGAKVIDITEKDLIEIQDAALTLDCAAIKYAMNKDHKRQIFSEMQQLIKSYKATEDEIERSKCIEELRDLLYKYADNSRLLALSRYIKGQQSILRSIYRKEKKGVSTIEYFIQIYEAMLAGDVNKAMKSMEDNYIKATEILRPVICKK